MESKFYSILQKLMADESVSINKLSKDKGIGRKSIAAYLNGECLPRYFILVKIADYFEVSTDYLLGLEPFDGRCYKSSCEEDEIPERFLKQLKALMQEKKLTQYRLAKKLKVEQTTVSKWFNRKTMPETQIFIFLANIFDCKVDLLLSREVTQ